MMREMVFASLLLLVVSSGICATSNPQATARVKVERAASANAQIARAELLIQQMVQTPAPQKFDLFAEAWANLAIVRQAWPNDSKAGVRSGIIQADLAGQVGLWSRMIDVLQEIAPAAASTGGRAQVEKRLGYAFERTGDFGSAEAHLLAAEGAMHGEHLNRVDSEDILTTLGTFYSRQNKPASAIQRFREARDLQGQDVVNRTRFQLAILEESIKIGSDVAIPELAKFDELYTAAQSSSSSPADMTFLAHMSQQAQRSRDKLHH